MTIDDLIEISAVRALCKTGYARQIREAAHLTLPEVGALLGVDQSTVSKWETGNRIPGAPDVAIRYGALLRRLLVEGGLGHGPPHREAHRG